MTHEEMCEAFKRDYPKFVLEDFYFECDVGWFELLKEFFDSLSQMLETKDVSLQQELYISQIKEKFGLIRIYVSEYDDDINQLIIETEQKSKNICESCGNHGILRTSGWYKVRCDACEEIFVTKCCKK